MARLLRALFWMVVIATPLAGAWLASSLAAYLGFDIRMAALAGLLLFPILPLAWLALSAVRFRRKHPGRQHLLRFGDRLLWRTLLLDVGFLALLLARWPQESFLALSTRGDWMLEGRSGSNVEFARRGLLATAGTVEWVYLWAHPNPYVQDHTRPPPPPPPPPAATSTPRATPTETPVATGTAVVESRPSPAATPSTAIPTGAPSWPMSATLDPVVAALPAADEASIDSVGRYLGTHIPGDPFRLAKAVHDYVANRIAYDFAALHQDPIPPAAAEAQAVWENRKGVCAGYANLFVAVARAAGMEAVYLTGDARDTLGGTAPTSHAWNAVKIQDAWYLVDTTWDAGSADPVDGGMTFHKQYRTLYLFTPPEAFGLDHFPAEEGWQLRSSPISRSEFTRQPLIGPAFVSEGLALVAPDRPQVTAGSSLEVEVKNPRAMSLLVSARRGSTLKDCDVAAGAITRARCRFDQPGAWRVLLFSSTQQLGRHEYVAGIDVNASP